MTARRRTGLRRAGGQAAAARTRWAALGLGVALAGLVSGCASFQPPQPWEKGDLAKPQMQLDPDPLAAKGREHIYQSKEGASGGYGVGGGGCGCN